MMEQEKSLCPLCDLYQKREIKTRFYFETDRFIVVDCQTCQVPMVVWKEHKPNLTYQEKNSMIIEVGKKMAPYFEGKHFTWDDKMKQIPSHYHMHLRSY